MEPTAILLLHCPDKLGIITEITKFITDNNGNIVYLDQYAKDTEALTAYQAAYGEMQTVKQEIRRLSMDEAEKLRRVETLEYQIAEIEKAELEAGEEEFSC